MISWPGLQSFHGTHCVAGSPSWSQVPIGQGTGAAVPPAQNSPAAQGAQDRQDAPQLLGRFDALPPNVRDTLIDPRFGQTAGRDAAE